ncbi:MAG: HAMP domain-containing sensor histidine kinase [Clostridiales bacterium]|nr:HAMP domain-containing sensor histidine kinase [Clostridiales bacterium]
MKSKVSRSLRLYASFIIFIMLSISMIFTAAIGLSLYRAGMLRSIFASPFTFILWIYTVSIVISTVLTALAGKWLLSPILKISRASNQVAKGDFKIRLDTDSYIEEVQQTYVNFNHMVEELGTIETLRSDFIANVSHEFKTPLNAIEGYATLLQDRSLTEDEEQEYVEKILFNTSRLSELAGNILMLSKVENQTIPAEVTHYQLDEQIRQSLVMLAPKWSAKEIDMDIELDDIYITNSESLLMQVWLNIIGNAIKFSPVGGRITVRLFKDSGVIVATVRDEGIGMSGETLKHIFEKFYQGDTSHRSEGNGIGLSLVKKILDLCGGRISVTSAEGEGSTFKVTLPETR